MSGANQINIQRLLEERETLAREAEALANRIEGLERAIEIVGGIVEPNPRESTSSPEIAVRPPFRSKIAVIRAVLASSGASGLSVSGVVENARAQGVDLNKASVGSTLSRMKNKGEVTFINGRYHSVGQS